MAQQTHEAAAAGAAPGADTLAAGLTVQEATGRVIDDAAQEPGPIVVAEPILKPPGVPDDSGFFDPDRPDSTDGAQSIRMTRLVEEGHETFKLDEPIGYWDREVGAILVPGNLARFRTDLTSVPRYFGWLVTPTGMHLPAALVHDGLIDDPDDPSSYVANVEIDRVTADRIFRSAMQDLGTSWVLRWVIWTAVAVATMVTGPLRRVWTSMLAVGATVLAVLVGGTLASLDLVDCRAPIPWMADRPVWFELLSGAVGAVVVPTVLSVLWGRRWRAGVIAGVALALLLHVTVAVVLVFAVFSTIDGVVERKPVPALRWAAIAGAIVAASVLIGVLAC